jgi:hypothetical protein
MILGGGANLNESDDSTDNGAPEKCVQANCQREEAQLSVRRRSANSEGYQLRLGRGSFLERFVADAAEAIMSCHQAVMSTYADSRLPTVSQLSLRNTCETANDKSIPKQAAGRTRLS